ncbi:hypothetical protein ACSTI3_23620, partial [Vibrio parahaemolyticus]
PVKIAPKEPQYQSPPSEFRFPDFSFARPPVEPNPTDVQPAVELILDWEIPVSPATFQISSENLESPFAVVDPKKPPESRNLT